MQERPPLGESGKKKEVISELNLNSRSKKLKGGTEFTRLRLGEMWLEKE